MFFWNWIFFYHNLNFFIENQTIFAKSNDKTQQQTSIPGNNFKFPGFQQHPNLKTFTLSCFFFSFHLLIGCHKIHKSPLPWLYQLNHYLQWMSDISRKLILIKFESSLSQVYLFRSGWSLWIWRTVRLFFGWTLWTPRTLMLLVLGGIGGFHTYYNSYFDSFVCAPFTLKGTIVPDFGCLMWTICSICVFYTFVVSTIKVREKLNSQTSFMVETPSNPF